MKRSSKYFLPVLLIGMILLSFVSGAFAQDITSPQTTGEENQVAMPESGDTTIDSVQPEDLQPAENPEPETVVSPEAVSSETAVSPEAAAIPETQEAVQESTEQVPFQYTSVDDGIKLTAYTGQESAPAIPAQVDGLNVVELGEGLFKDNSNILSITVPDGILRIDDSSFENCPNLEIVYLPDSLTAVGPSAFTGTSGVKISAGKNTSGALYALDNGIALVISPDDTADDTTANVESAVFDLEKDYEEIPELLAAINEQRVNNGLNELTLDADLTEAAMLRAAELNVLYSHERPDGRYALTAIADFNGQTVGENVTDNYNNAADFMEDSLNSASHLNNILGTHYNSIGIGVIGNKLVEIYSDKTDANPEIPTSDQDAAVTVSFKPEYLIGTGVKADVYSLVKNNSKDVVFEAYFNPEKVSLIPENVTVSDPAVLSASYNNDSDVELYGLENGSADVNFSSGTLKHTQNFTVADQASTAAVRVTDVEVEPDRLTLNPGVSHTLSVVIEPYNASNKTVTWTSSNPQVATVSSSGKVTAYGTGSATITATANDGSYEKDTCRVTVVTGSTGGVSGIKVRDIEINPEKLTLSPGSSYTLALEVTPANATNKSVTWTSSNTSVATVSSTGRVTAVKNGSATITATAKDGSNEKDTCRVTVSSGSGSTGGVKIRDIDIEPEKITLSPGSSYNLTVEIEPYNASNKTLTWTSSNTAVATVSSTGRVTAVKAGTATITAAARDGSNVKDTCRVTVSGGSGSTGGVKIRDIDIEPDKITLSPGSSYTLALEITPYNATNKTVTWRSSNTAVATVSSGGRVTAVKAGTAVITATANDGSGESDTCRVTVSGSSGSTGSIKIRDLEIEPDKLTLAPGSSYTLTVEIEPYNATNKKLTWTSSNPSVATVSSTGRISAVKAGTAVITATTTDGSYKSDICRVTVSGSSGSGGIRVDDIEVQPEWMTLSPGMSQTLYVEVEPYNASNKKVTYNSSNPSVATVNASGKVTAVKAGSAVITVTAADGSRESDTCRVIVR